MKTKTKKPLVVIAVTLLLIVLVFFISLNLGVIKIAPLQTLKVFFGQGTARDELVLFEFRAAANSFVVACWGGYRCCRSHFAKRVSK